MLVDRVASGRAQKLTPARGRARAGVLGRWRVAACLVSAAAVVAGCGGQDEPTPAPGLPAVSAPDDLKLTDARPDPDSATTPDTKSDPGGVGSPNTESDPDSATTPDTASDPDSAGLPDTESDPDSATTPGTASDPGGVDLPDAESVAGADADDGEAGRSQDSGGSIVGVPEAAGGSQPGTEASGRDGDGASDEEAIADLSGPVRFQHEGIFFELGFRESWPDRYDLDVFRDEVAVRTDSVLVHGGVVRGLVQNMSERLFARHVTVSVGDDRWVFPLTVQPSEVVPFEIEGYAGPSDPESIGFEVSAQFVPEPDPRRAFLVTEGPGFWADTWDEIGYQLHSYPHIVRPEGVSRDDWVQAYETLIQLRQPTSHPSITDEVAGLVVEDLRVYLTMMNDEDRILDVSEMIPYMITDGRPVPVRRLDGTSSFHVVFLSDYNENFSITVGGVHGGAG